MTAPIGPRRQENLHLFAKRIAAMSKTCVPVAEKKRTVRSPGSVKPTPAKVT